VPAGTYYYDAIRMAKALGIARGTASGAFLPQSFMTIQEAIWFLSSAR
jgi:hypothetical protein